MHSRRQLHRVRASSGASRPCSSNRGGRSALRLAALLTLLLTPLLGACSDQYDGVRPVTVRVSGTAVTDRLMTASYPHLPYAVVFILDCAGTEACPVWGSDAIEFTVPGDDERAVRATAERCTDSWDDCELVFTPEQPSLTVWLPDGIYRFQARAYAEAAGTPKEYCQDAVFTVGPRKDNAVEVQLEDCP